MKTNLILFILLLTAVTAQSQTITGQFLKKIPALPDDTCNITISNMNAFNQKVAVLIDEIESQLNTLNEAVDNKMETNEDVAKQHAMKQMSQQYGLTPEQMQQMQSGNMSAAEKQALANQMMQQQTNMSMDEVQNLSKMSEEGKKAYMEAYGTEMMATGQTPQNQQNADNAKNLNQLITEQQAVMARINTYSQKTGNLYATINNDPELRKSYRNIEGWQSKLMSMTGVDYGQGKQMDSLSLLIKNEQINICNKFTPRYRTALNQHLPLMKATIPDNIRLAQLTAELTKMQTGVTPPPENVEIGNLQLIKGYLDALKDAYKFKTYFPEDNSSLLFRP